jgi:solute carrier family 25 (mitochondrial carnitine/acylcarnitine transporter), member 20/29
MVNLIKNKKSYWMSIYPLDVVKNRMMSQPDTKPLKYPNVISCFKSIYQIDGIKGFFRGFVPCALRTFPANGSTWLALKFIKDYLDRLDIYFN